MPTQHGHGNGGPLFTLICPAGPRSLKATLGNSYFKSCFSQLIVILLADTCLQQRRETTNLCKQSQHFLSEAERKIAQEYLKTGVKKLEDFDITTDGTQEVKNDQEEDVIPGAGRLSRVNIQAENNRKKHNITDENSNLFELQS